MTKHTNGEIEQAKMLGKKLSALQDVSTTPKDRAWSATTLFLIACWQLVRNTCRRNVRQFRNAIRRTRNAIVGRRFQCPHCLGCRNLPEDNTNVRCVLCSSTGFISQAQRESVAYGRMLLHWRGDHRASVGRAADMLNVQPLEIGRLENGYVPVAEWPRTAREIAEQQMRDEFREA